LLERHFEDGDFALPPILKDTRCAMDLAMTFGAPADMTSKPPKKALGVVVSQANFGKDGVHAVTVLVG
jgi:hypothetical protein